MQIRISRNVMKKSRSLVEYCFTYSYKHCRKHCTTDALYTFSYYLLLWQLLDFLQNWEKLSCKVESLVSYFERLRSLKGILWMLELLFLDGTKNNFFPLTFRSNHYSWVLNEPADNATVCKHRKKGGQFGRRQEIFRQIRCTLNTNPSFFIFVYRNFALLEVVT